MVILVCGWMWLVTQLKSAGEAGRSSVPDDRSGGGAGNASDDGDDTLTLGRYIESPYCSDCWNR